MRQISKSAHKREKNLNCRRAAKNPIVISKAAAFTSFARINMARKKRHESFTIITQSLHF